MRLLSPGERVWDPETCRARLGTLVAIGLGSIADYAAMWAKIVWDDGAMQTMDPRRLMPMGHSPRYLEITEDDRREACRGDAAP